MNAITTRTTRLFDVGDANAEPGSPAWCRAAVERIRELKRQSQDAVSSLKYRLLAFAKDQHFTQLADRDGVVFSTWEDFVQYPEPFGLGMRVEVVRAIMTERDDRRLLRDVIDAVPVLLPHGTNQYSIGRDNIMSTDRGTSSSYLISKLKRDAPAIAEQLAAGEYRSVRAAALAAGIVKPTTALMELQRAWKRATAKERRAFLREIAP